MSGPTAPRAATRNARRIVVKGGSGVAARAGGSLEIHSIPGRGTTVRLRLPAASGDAPEALASRERAGSA